MHYSCLPRSRCREFFERGGGDEAPQSGHLGNRILEILGRPFGGLNEILALLELDHCLKNFNYDVVVLDTAPSAHFIDFLKSGDRIHQFFNKSFVEVFQYLNRGGESVVKKGSKSGYKGFVKLVVKTGIKKLLTYMEYLTGKNFVQDFIAAISSIYSLKETFLPGI